MKDNKQMKNQKYEFSWNLLGDIAEGRPNLGIYTRIETYRLMQFTFRDVIEKAVGTESTDRIFFDAGKLAGEQFYKNALSLSESLNDYISQLQRCSKISELAFFVWKKLIWRAASLC